MKHEKAEQSMNCWNDLRFIAVKELISYLFSKQQRLISLKLLFLKINLIQGNSKDCNKNLSNGSTIP